METRSPAALGRLALVTLLVACAFLGVHVLFRHVYPDAVDGVTAYRYRDDALITLSHARGLVDVGTVSVSSSGSRVEGYSAPLQFAFAYGFYDLGGASFRTFLDAQVLASTALLGASVFVLLRLAAPRRSLLTTALAALSVAVGLFATYAFFGWHSSGMENSITNAAAVAAVAALAAALSVGRSTLLPIAGIAVGLLAVTRVEFVFHAAPLLLVAAGFVALRSPPGQVWRRIGLLVGPAVALWFAVQLARVWYFGSLRPNTAEAQGIAPGANVERWARVLWPLLIPLVYASVQAVRRRFDSAARIVGPGLWVATGVGLVVAAILARRADLDQPLPGVDGFREAARVLGLWWWLAIVGGLALIVWRRRGVVEVLLATLVVTGLAHLFVFGPARLAGERVVTFVLVPLAALTAALALQVEPGKVRRAIPNVATAARLGAGATLLAIAVGGAWSSHRTWAEEQLLCCDTTELAERILAEAATVRRDTGLPTVSVANADLGLVSLGKTVNVTDLGGLGDPLLARVWSRGYTTGRVDVAVDYLNHYAAPDVVEIHGNWSCQYAPWWQSADFTALYQQVWDDGWTAGWAPQGCPTVAGVRGGIWVRADLVASPPGAEVALSRRLASRPDPAIVRHELAACRSGDPRSCQYVTRAVYRNLERLDRAGRLDEVVQAFTEVPSAPYDQALLGSRSRGDWYENAEDFLFARS